MLTEGVSCKISQTATFHVLKLQEHAKLDKFSLSVMNEPIQGDIDKIL